MNKADLVAGVYGDGYPMLTGVRAERIVDGILARIEEALANGDSLVIRDFGTLKVHQRPAGRGRNPRTGEPVSVKARKVVRFKPGLALKAAVAGV